jgi:predicted nucleotidyltransferase
MSNTKISEIDSKIEATVKLLKTLDFVHSILLFGSISKKRSGNDIDICYIPSREMNLKERLAINSSLPAGIDISMYYDLPVHIRKRISEEGKVLYTKEMYGLLTILKENDLEYSGYKKYREYYNNAIEEMFKKRFVSQVG